VNDELTKKSMIAGKKTVPCLRPEAVPAARSTGDEPEAPAEQASFLQAVGGIAAGAVERHMPNLPPTPPEE
jgi:hypothetical protein